MRRLTKLWDRHASFKSQNAHRFDEPNVFFFANKTKHIAFGTAAKAVVLPLPVINVETSGTFLMKRTWRPHVTFARIRFSFIPNHRASSYVGQRSTSSQFLNRIARQAHF